MLTRNTKKLLRAIQKSHKEQRGKTNILSVDDLFNETFFEVKEFYTALDELESQELIRFTDWHKTELILKERGIFYSEISVREAINLALRSIVFPIIVAVITSIITVHVIS